MNYHQRLMKIENRIKTDRMKKVLLSFVLAVMAVTGYAQSQMNLVGREYHCDNMLTGKFKDAVVEAKEKAIKEKEKQKGRKLSDAEQKELDSEIKQNQAELNAIKEGTKMSMTFYFKNATEMIDNLTLEYNRVRQSKITQEITEIVAGAGSK